MDSGASMHFTNDINDFVEYDPLKKPLRVQTASKDTAIHIKGVGSVVIDYMVEPSNGTVFKKTMCLHPVFFIPDLGI